MTTGDACTDPLVCPKCESRSARFVPSHPPESVLVDYSPLDNEVSRWVILYLKQLAEHPRDQWFMRKLNLSTREGMDVLWDRELDA
jgi:hypothetical protein